MKSTDEAAEGIVLLQKGVWEVRPRSAGHLRQCIAEVRLMHAVRSVVLDLSMKTNSASSGDTELGLSGFPVPLISAASGDVRGWKAEAVLQSHLCFSENAATFDGRPFNTGSPNPDEEKDRILTATEMVRQGHLNGPVCDGNALASARKAAGRIALMAPIAIKACLEAVSASAERAADEGLEIEVKLFAQLFETEDMRLGIKAFLSKTQPEFRGV